MRAGLKTTILIAMLTAFASVAFAVPDGLGTNHVQNLRVHQRLDLGGVAITNWQEVAESTLTTDSIETDMIQDDAITTDKIADGAVTEDELAGSVAGDGLTGGDGTPLSVDLVPDGGLGFTLEQLGVDATVIRTTGDQTITGDTTLVGDTTLQDGNIVITNATLTIPEPSDPSHAATQRYVDDKLSSSVADGAGEGQILRWDDTAKAWTNTAVLVIDEDTNKATIADDLDVGGAAEITGTLDVTGATTLGDLAVGDTTVTGTLGVTGATAITGTLHVTEAVTFDDALSVDDITITGDIDFTGAQATSDLNMDGNRITGLAAPDAATDAATKRYVDNAINGLSWKQAVRLATTEPVADFSNLAAGNTLDGETLVAGDRILIKDQGNEINNGIYVVRTGENPVRAADMTNTVQLAGAAVFVAEGTANNGTAWVVTTPDANVGSQDITFAQFASPGTYEAGDGLDLTGLEFSVVVDEFAGFGIEDDGANNLRIAAEAAGLGLTGGGGDGALQVDAGRGLDFDGNVVRVDDTVVRTSDNFTIGGQITFTNQVVVPAPDAPMHAATRQYVDDKLSSSVADGSAPGQTLRWDDGAESWTNTAALVVGADGSVSATGTLSVAKGVTLDETLAVGGDTTVAGTLGVTGATSLDDLGVGGLATVAGALGVGGATTISNTLDVTGATTLDDVTIGGSVLADMNMGGNRITGLAAPSDATDAATRRYVDNVINGLSWKQPVRVVSTTQIDRTNVTVIDGVPLDEGDRVLLQNQGIAKSEHGIYVFNGVNALDRAADMTNDTQFVSAAVFVFDGPNKGTAWVCNDPASGERTFVQFASPGTYQAGDTMTLSPELVFDVNVGALVSGSPTLEVDDDILRIAEAAAGDGLTGGGTVALAVDASVIRTTGDFTLEGNITFDEPVTVAEPTADTHAVTRGWVNERLSSSVASGAADDQTLRWDDTAQAWTNNANFTVNEDGNVVAAGTLGVAGATTLDDTLTVTGLTTVSNITATGDANIAGTLDVTDEVNLASDLTVVGDATIESDLNVEGTTTIEGSLVTKRREDTILLTGATIPTPDAAYALIRGNDATIDATQITAGVAGQTITFQGATGSNWVTLKTGGNLQLNSGIDFTLKPGNIIQFIYDGTNWRETFRTVHTTL